MEKHDDVIIRPATEDDIPAILAAYADSGIDRGECLSPREARRIFERMSGYPDYRVYVAMIHGTLCGTFALLIMDNLAHGGAPSGIVEDVAVPAKYQRRGIGRKMMDFAQARCADAGCYKLMLSSNEIRSGAHRFYESLGFERHGFSYRISISGAKSSARRPPLR